MKNQEMYCRKTYKNFNELEIAITITGYIYYYNTKRIKEKLNWHSPIKYRFEYGSKVI
ncbi:IS3 family transposase [Clostridioides difficile]|uniref:IS3 family transposase n=3 Tax=Clostridioides difficile TaxID=1496 RepID=UPI00374F415A